MSALKTDRHKVEGEKLVLDSGRVATFPFPIAQFVDFESVIVVRLDIPQGKIFNENVFGVDRQGQKLWQIERKSHVYNDSPYTHLSRKDDYVVAGNFDGLELLVEPDTGRTVKERRERGVTTDWVESI